MQIKHRKTMKTTALSVTALAASSALGKTPTGRIGLDALTLEEVPTQTVTVCAHARHPENEDKFSGMMSNTLSIAVDSSKRRQVKMSFVISEMRDTTEDRVLYLVYSTRKSPSPQILTTDLGPGLGIDIFEMEPLGIYHVSARLENPQPVTRVGQALPFSTSKMTVDVNFDTSKIDDLIRNGKETIYVQAALIRASDLEAGLFENMILSEMDTLTFVPNECPADTVESYEADEYGTITIIKSPSQNSTANPNSNPNPGGKKL
jgi:hypothetical protein